MWCGAVRYGGMGCDDKLILSKVPSRKIHAIELILFLWHCVSESIKMENGSKNFLFIYFQT